MAKVIDQSHNPALGQLLKEMRSREEQKDRHRFRRNMKLIGTLMAYEIAASLPSVDTRVETPLGHRSVRVLRQPPVLGTALRAGVPFLDGMLEVFRDSDVMFFGASREEGVGPDASLSMKIALSYQALSPCEGRELIFADPMIATGSTIFDIHAAITAQKVRPSRFIVAGLVGFLGAAERLEAKIPACEVWLATADDALDARGYIVPGLGDAGDLCYGAKA
ncbi:MAG: uracil phosphoribosyltransferase [Planctomycetes bacterium]|nr:uracil phosphoribosyltransferase [Planctomycetota bacterium]